MTKLATPPLLVEIDENGNFIPFNKETKAKELYDAYDDMDINFLEDKAEEYNDAMSLYKDDYPELSKAYHELQQSADNLIQLFYMNF